MCIWRVCIGGVGCGWAQLLPCQKLKDVYDGIKATYSGYGLPPGASVSCWAWMSVKKSVIKSTLYSAHSCPRGIGAALVWPDGVCKLRADLQLTLKQCNNALGVSAFEKELQAWRWPSQHLHFILIIVRNWECMSSLSHSGFYLVSDYIDLWVLVLIRIDAQTL